MSVLGIIFLVTAILIVGTLVLANFARKSERKITVWMVTLILGGMVTMAFAGGGGLWYIIRLYQHDTCVNAVASRHDFRDSKSDEFAATAKAYNRDEAFYDAIDAALKSSAFTSTSLIVGQPSLRTALQTQRGELAADEAKFQHDFPEKNPDACPVHP